MSVAKLPSTIAWGDCSGQIVRPYPHRRRTAPFLGSVLIVPCWNPDRSEIPPGPLHSSAPVGVCPNDSEDIHPLENNGSDPSAPRSSPGVPRTPTRTARRRRSVIFSPPALINSMGWSRNSPNRETAAFLRLCGPFIATQNPPGSTDKADNRAIETASIGRCSPLASTAPVGGPPLRCGPSGDPSAHLPELWACRCCREPADRQGADSHPPRESEEKARHV